MSALTVPVIRDDMDVMMAALAYAEAGWYVLPVEPDTKRPAKILGGRWQHETSRDPQQIVSWFAGTSLALGLHVGRSGAVVFDLDEPELTPEPLAEAIVVHRPPRQSTRTDGERGHVVFATPPGRRLSNSRGDLRDADGSGGRKWGEVRGENGLIVVEPSHHSKPGGRYKWVRTGEVPVLPKSVADLLPDSNVAADVADDATVRSFLAAHNGASKPHLLAKILDSFKANAHAGARHEALVDAMAWGMREARAGLYPATAVKDGLWPLWKEAMADEPRRFPKSEFAGVLSWAVSQALQIDPGAKAAEIERRLDAAKDSAAATDDDGGVDFFDPSTHHRADAAPERKANKRSPADYFPSREEGLDVDLLAHDVIAKGPLAVGKDERFWKYENGVWVEDNEEVRGRVVDLLLGRYRGSHATNTEHVVRRRVGRIECEPVSRYINMRNGMLDWRTGELVPHDPAFKSTVQLPVRWDPDATCPEFDKFLKGILSQDYIDLAWEMIGYLMYSGNPMQVAFLFHGSGENGKGTLMRVIEALLGPENVSQASLDSINTNRFTAADLFGKIANLAGDIDATYQESTAMFKKMTGEDALAGEHKYGAAFRFVSWAVPVFSANKIPGSADTSAGYLRRWIVLNFNRRISKGERILGYSDQLIEELPGIAAKAVATLRVLMERGRFDIKGDVEQGHEEFATTLDQVRQWVEECCEPDDGSEERGVLYKSYCAWAQVNGMGRLKSGEFWHRLDNAGYRPVKVNGTRRHKGLRVKEMRMKAEGLTQDEDFFKQ